jgi:peptide/nickel transport system permease protein
MMMVIVSICAPFFAPYDPAKLDLKSRLAPPSAVHAFGTDALGRDVLSRVIYGGRTVLSGAFEAVAISFSIGLTAGIFAGYKGGWLDNLLMRLMDILLSFPSVLLAILIVASLGAGQTNVVIAISVAQIPIFARLVRSIVLILRIQEYVVAAQSLGARDRTIIFSHLFPNMLPPMLVQATAMLAIAMATLTALSFLGLGVETGTPDWGLMVADGQRLLFDAPHVAFFPGLCLVLAVLSINFIGDGLRDHLDPRLRNQAG